MNKEIKKPALTFSIIVIAWLFLDQAVKLVERLTMKPGQSIAIIKNVFHLTYVRNEGAAFSILQGKMLFFFAVTIISLIAVYFFWKIERPSTFLPVVGSALMVGGTFGNLIDRVVFSHVIDIFDARFINFAIFNVADIGITVGVALIAIWIVFYGGFFSESE